MKKRKPVLERINEKLNVDILGVPDRDVHWVWQGALPTRQRKKIKKRVRELHQTPPRIRDEDGVTRSVSRILHRIFKGEDYPYHLPRISGCDYTCVNPYHMTYPTVGFEDVEVKATTEDEDIQGLVDELREFIAAKGSDEHAIRDRFGLDYTEEEITIALERVT